MSPQPFETFQSSLKDYYNQVGLSDASISCDGQEFQVHRIILSIHSKYFAKIFTGPWKESSERAITIEDFDLDAVEAMLKFMYSFDYDYEREDSLMCFHAKVYQIADKYDIPALKEHAKGLFGEAIASNWQSDGFSLAISMVYSSTPQNDRGLRDLVVEISHKHIDELLDNERFCNALREAADFAADLIPFLSGKRLVGCQWHRCPSCQCEFLGDFSDLGYYYCPACGHRRRNWQVCRVKR